MHSLLHPKAVVCSFQVLSVIYVLFTTSESCRMLISGTISYLCILWYIRKPSYADFRYYQLFMYSLIHSKAVVCWFQVLSVIHVFFDTSESCRMLISGTISYSCILWYIRNLSCADFRYYQLFMYSLLHPKAVVFWFKVQAGILRYTTKSA